jgi:heme iron utilization protein
MALLERARQGVLSTYSAHRPGFPFGSVVPYALDERGRPLFLISAMALHTQNLRADPRASLFVQEPGADRDPLSGARVTVIGAVTPLAEEERASARALYLERQPQARAWADFQDFAFYRMDVAAMYFVGGFGVMGWVD